MNAGRPTGADDKLAVLLALVPYLYEERVVSVAEAAEQLDLTPATIRDAVRLIAVTGVAGDDDIPMPNEMFDIDWEAFLDEDVIVLSNTVAIDGYLRFSASEAAALIAGLGYLARLPVHEGEPRLADLEARLRAGTIGLPVPLALSDGADALVESNSRADAASLDVIAAARAAGRRLEFDYRSRKDETLRRQVDPIEVASDGPVWYLRAYCHTRHGIRVFRLDRMSGLAVSPLPADPHDGLPPADEFFQPSDSDLRIVVDVAAGGLPFLADYLADSATHPVGDRTRATLRIAQLATLSRLVASLPGLVTVVEPAEARAAVAAWAQAGLERYR